MEWWIKEEIDKYKDRKVLFNDAMHTVKEIYWQNSSEEFVYYIEDSKGKLLKVFEHNISLC